MVLWYCYGRVRRPEGVVAGEAAVPVRLCREDGLGKAWAHFQKKSRVLRLLDQLGRVEERSGALFRSFDMMGDGCADGKRGFRVCGRSRCGVLGVRSERDPEPKKCPNVGGAGSFYMGVAALGGAVCRAASEGPRRFCSPGDPASL